MIRCSLRIFAFGSLFFLASVSTIAATGACDRACLKGFLDQYLAAMIKHDTSVAPLFVGFRQTENAMIAKPGEGLWKTMTGLGEVQRRYADPVNGQAGYFGIILEGDNKAIATLRLKVEDRQITEAEWVFARTAPLPPNAPPPASGRGPSGPEGLALLPPPSDKPLPRTERSSRAAMLAAANSYFDGLQAHDGSVVMSKPGCSRVENGGSVTGRGVGRGGEVVDRGDCASNFQMFTMRVAARRYPIVDEETGAVLSMVVFIRPPGSPQKRNLLTEWITIDQNKISAIYAAMFYPEQDLPIPNWPPYDGNYPEPLLPGMSAPAGGPGAAAPNGGVPGGAGRGTN
jgi:hypothetical protein